MSTPTTATPGTSVAQYLVISAGVKNSDGSWQEGGELFAFALTPVEGVATEAILAMLGVKNNEIDISGKFTIPAERLNILGLIIKWKSHVENLTVEAQIVDETTMAGLKAGAIGVSINL
jgi:hypothetical protein